VGSAVVAAVAVAGLLAWPATGAAKLGVVGNLLASPSADAEPTAGAEPTVVGQASGVRATTSRARLPAAISSPTSPTPFGPSPTPDEGTLCGGLATP
jgi:hypothetical protein